MMMVSSDCVSIPSSPINSNLSGFPSYRRLLCNNIRHCRNGLKQYSNSNIPDLTLFYQYLLLFCSLVVNLPALFCSLCQQYCADKWIIQFQQMETTGCYCVFSCSLLFFARQGWKQISFLSNQIFSFVLSF